MDPMTIRIVCGGLVLVFGALIFLRRRGQKTEYWTGIGPSQRAARRTPIHRAYLTSSGSALLEMSRS